MPHNICLLDGGMGRELERRGAPFRQPEWSALAMIEAPEMVQAVHTAFIHSGADVVTTNSYALVPFHIGEARFHAQAQTLAERAGQVARHAATDAESDVRVAGSLPPLCGSYRPDLFQAEQVARLAEPLIRGLAPYVDVWLAETQSLIAESVALKTVLDHLDPTGKPLWVSFTLEDESPGQTARLRSGETVTAAVEQMIALGASAILFNCCQPEVVETALTEARQVLEEKALDTIQLGAYANAFPPQAKDAMANDGLDEVRQDLTPSAYLAWTEKWSQQGASLLGGCCGIGPEHIARMHEHFRGEGH